MPKHPETIDGAVTCYADLCPIDLRHRQYNLDGSDGNAFAVIAAVTNVLEQFRGEYCTAEDFRTTKQEFTTAAFSGDYENLLREAEKLVQFGWIRDGLEFRPAGEDEKTEAEADAEWDEHWAEVDRTHRN